MAGKAAMARAVWSKELKRADRGPCLWHWGVSPLPVSSGALQSLQLRSAQVTPAPNPAGSPLRSALKLMSHKGLPPRPTLPSPRPTPPPRSSPHTHAPAPLVSLLHPEWLCPPLAQGWSLCNIGVFVCPSPPSSLLTTLSQRTLISILHNPSPHALQFPIPLPLLFSLFYLALFPF